MPAFRARQPVDGGYRLTDSTDNQLGAPSVSTVVAKHVQLGPFVQTTLRLNNVAQSVVNGTEYQGTKIYDFPEGQIQILGCVATLQQKTTSTIASTLNSGVTGAIALGTVTASSTTLSSTMANLLPSTAFTTSTTINVAGTAVSNALAATTTLDGRTTAIDMYLNTAYATTTDVDADATQTISGWIKITWVMLGDTPITG